MRDNSGSGFGSALGLAALAGGGVYATIQVIKYLDRDRADKATKEANEKALAYQVSLNKTNQRIAQIENNAWRKGVNGYGKNVSVNIINEAKDAVRAMYTSQTLKGIVKYFRKSSSSMNPGDFINAVFSVPLNSLNAFQKVYTIYTGTNILDDASRLDNVNYAKIKTLFKVSREKFPDIWKK